MTAVIFFRGTDIDGEQGSVLRMRGVLCSLLEPDQVSGFVNIAVIVLKLALQHQKFLVLGVFMRPCRGAWLHAIHVKSDAQFVVRIYLQYTLVGGRSVVVAKGLEFVAVDVDDAAVVRLNFLHQILL